MRTLKLQVQMSVDGYMAGPNGEMDWMSFDWGEDLIQFVTELTDPVDTIVLGRKLAEGFIPVWKARLEDPNADDHAAARKFVETPKVVFTNTLETHSWEYTELAKGELSEEINALKNKEGGDIIAYGGGTFVAGLIEAGLIDDLYLFVNPIAIGAGMPVFKGKTVLKLVASHVFECGIVVLHYQKG